jgi:hypothetical protein
MKRRTFLQTLASGLAMLSPLVQSQELKAQPFLLTQPEPQPKIEFKADPAGDTDLYMALRYAYMEQWGSVNDEITRRVLVSEMSDVLLAFQNSRKVYGWVVVCDESNNSPDIIDSNDLVADVSVRKVGDAEYTTYHFNTESVRGGLQ